MKRDKYLVRNSIFTILLITVFACAGSTAVVRTSKPNNQAVISKVDNTVAITKIIASPTEEIIATFTATLTITSTLEPSVTLEPSRTLEPRPRLRAEIERVLGDGNRHIPRITELNFDDPEKGAIFINWAINDNLTEGLLKFGAKSDATKIIKAVSKSGLEYTYVLISGSFLMVDQFGKESEDNVVNLTFYKATVDRINWDNFLIDNIYSIADEAHIWPAFRD